MVYFGIAMAQTKSKKPGATKRTVKSKSTSVRDIKPAKKKGVEFVVKEIEDDDIPVAEPLLEDMQEESDFEVNKVEMDIDYEPKRPPNINVQPVKDEKEEEKTEPSRTEVERVDESSAREFVKVRFGTFVNLIANRDLEEVFDANAEQQIIMNSNLLTELACTKDRREERKIPIVFLVGIGIGVVLTYIFFST